MNAYFEVTLRSNVVQVGGFSIVTLNQLEFYEEVLYVYFSNIVVETVVQK